MQKLLKCLYRDFETLNQTRLVFAAGEEPPKAPDAGSKVEQLPNMVMITSYVVKPGDSLWKIVENTLKDQQKTALRPPVTKNFPQITPDLIKRGIVNVMVANNMDSMSIKTGQTLKMPATLKDLLKARVEAGKARLKPVIAAQRALSDALGAKRKQKIEGLKKAEGAEREVSLLTAKIDLLSVGESTTYEAGRGRYTLIRQSEGTFLCPELNVAGVSPRQFAEAIYKALPRDLLHQEVVDSAHEVEMRPLINGLAELSPQDKLRFSIADKQFDIVCKGEDKFVCNNPKLEGDARTIAVSLYKILPEPLQTAISSGEQIPRLSVERQKENLTPAQRLESRLRRIGVGDQVEIQIGDKKYTVVRTAPSILVVANLEKNNSLNGEKALVARILEDAGPISAQTKIAVTKSVGADRKVS